MQIIKVNGLSQGGMPADCPACMSAKQHAKLLEIRPMLIISIFDIADICVTPEQLKAIPEWLWVLLDYSLEFVCV